MFAGLLLSGMFLSVLVIALATLDQLRGFSALATVTADANMPQLLDRHGKVLDTQIQRGWNQNQQMPLHQIPDRLQQAFILSEDKRFFSHAGVDWRARLNAAWQSIVAGEPVRGASTISEQVVRMLHPRARNLWAKWLETFEAYALERIQTKADILTFYLNQVPYGAERRGVAQAARYYFDRDLDTLSTKEMLALAVLARAPSVFAKPENTKRLEARIQQLAQRMQAHGHLPASDIALLDAQTLQITFTPTVSDVFHFAHHVSSQTSVDRIRIKTTVDGNLQAHVTHLLNERLQQLASRNVQNGAVLIADHQQHEVLAWVVSGDIGRNTPGAFIDAVSTPRQPGSTLKPFIYAMALEKGWTAATWLKDAPLETAVGQGLHSFRNFSRVFYGDITLREALANSLNIPAIKALDFVGINTAIDVFQRMGMQALTRNPSIYGEGLVLGNGEITLFELVQAYSVLADQGRYVPLRTIVDVDPSGRDQTTAFAEQLFSSETTSIISNILADAQARRLEFGTASSLSFPVETAVKTGTSTDHRDAWLVAYNHRYVVGIWMGNLTQEPMHEVTGSTGPALLAHSIFAELNRQQESRPLYLSPTLVRQPVCIDRSASGDCMYRDEWFAAGTAPNTTLSIVEERPRDAGKPVLRKPSDGLRMAMDPRVPDSLESFEFSLDSQPSVQSVHWYLNGEHLATTQSNTYSWPLSRGKHVLYAEVVDRQGGRVYSDAVGFSVK